MCTTVTISLGHSVLPSLLTVEVKMVLKTLFFVCIESSSVLNVVMTPLE